MNAFVKKTKQIYELLCKHVSVLSVRQSSSVLKPHAAYAWTYTYLVISVQPKL